MAKTAKKAKKAKATKRTKTVWKGASQLRPLLLPIDSLTYDKENARKHSQRNLSTIAASLREFGQVKPIVVRRHGRVIVAGNGTTAAASSEGWTHIACVVEGMTKARSKALGIVDNRASELADWDTGKLAAALVEAEIEDGVDALGFTADEIDKLCGQVADAVPDDLNDEPKPDPPKKRQVSFEARDKPPADADGYADDDAVSRWLADMEAVLREARNLPVGKLPANDYAVLMRGAQLMRAAKP